MKRITVFLLVLLVLSSIWIQCGRQAVRPTKAETAQHEPDPRAVSKYMDGVLYDLDRNPAAALLAYQEAFLYDSTSVDIPLAMARDYLVLGKRDAGIAYLNTALRINPEDLEAMSLLAQVYLQGRQLEQADSVYASMLKVQPGDAEALRGRGMIAQDREQFDNAIGFYQKYLDGAAAPELDIQTALADSYLQNGDVEKGEKLYLDMLKDDPDNAVALTRLGMISESKADTSSAVKYYQKAVALVPTLTEAVGRLGNILLARKDWSAAEDLFRRTIEADSTDVNGWLGLGTVLVTKGRTDSAKTVYRDAIEQFPQDARARMNLGQLSLEDGEYDAAFQAFKPVTELYPDNPAGWLQCGRALLSADSLEQAAAYFKEALERDRNSFFANYFLGSTLLQLGRNLESVPYLERCLEMVADPVRQVPIMGSLASAYDAIGRYAVSDSLYQKALSLDPNNSTILNNYSYSLSQRGLQLPKALEMVLKALKQEPENGAFLDTAGWIYHLLGDNAKALDYLEQAWAVRNISAEVADHLADVYAVTGKMDKAVQFWRESLKLDPDNEIIRAKLDRAAVENKQNPKPEPIYRDH